MISVIGGTLYQWGIGRKVGILPCGGEEVCEVHFAHARDKVSIVVTPQIVNGVICAEIPNILLQSSEQILVYAVEKKDNSEKCFCNTTLFVRPRQKPDDYVYTETEVRTYAALEKRIKDLEDRDPASISEEQIAKEVTEQLTAAKESGLFDGADGKDGVDGKDGADGKDGYTPVKGVDYFDGADGKTGEDGYTPVKGVDYYTESDKSEMVNAVIAALPTWEGGSY